MKDKNEINKYRGSIEYCLVERHYSLNSKYGDRNIRQF